MWIDNNLVFCKESVIIDIENEFYLVGCFFFCCWWCNVEYYSCVFIRSVVWCLELVYRCVEDCVKGSLFEIVVYGWWFNDNECFGEWKLVLKKLMNFICRD